MRIVPLSVYERSSSRIDPIASQSTITLWVKDCSFRCIVTTFTLRLYYRTRSRVVPSNSSCCIVTMSTLRLYYSTSLRIVPSAAYQQNILSSCILSFDCRVICVILLSNSTIRKSNIKVSFKTTYTSQCLHERLTNLTYVKWNYIFQVDNGINNSNET